MNWEYLIRLFGYPVIALAIGLESMGLPMPGETSLLIGAALAANGHLNLFFVISSSALGAILGDNIGYFLGRKYGRSIFTRFIKFDESRLAQAEGFFKRHGPKTVFIARFVPIVRMFAALLAGINRMPALEFLIYNALGGLAWATLMGAVGYFFGQHLGLLETWLRRTSIALVVLIVLGVILFFLNRHWRHNEATFRAGVIGRLSTQLAQLLERFSFQGKTVGVAIYLAFLVGAAWLLRDVIDAWLEKEAILAQVDRAVSPWLKQGLTELPFWLQGWVWLGDLRILLGIGLLTALWALVHNDRRIALLTVANGIGAFALAWALQTWLRRPLPAGGQAAWGSAGFSLPNLAGFMSTVIYGWSAYLWARERSWAARINAHTAAAFVVMGISLFALVQQQGYLSDVIAGWALGVLWLGLPIGLLQWLTDPSRSAATEIDQTTPVT